ncbi:MAG: ROK family transcriptional regulator [Anaerolineales bacterium]|nr:ROK family transcriptional regulator [Anaerolineales bacterium]MCX7609019.1 ROK family transcriptional regulator [Anaerolineales bacterium]MDW8227289.1 ROK family transcriptional regulator [Anaerolineales bacterium]
MSTFSPPALVNNVKHINKYAVLDLIRFSAGGISRVDIARQLGLTRAAVTTIVNDLLHANVIREAESIYRPAGRPPTVLEINPSTGYVLGIDVGATHLHILLTDMAARICEEQETEFDIRVGPQAGIAEIDRQVHLLLQKAGISLESILAIGIGVPGPIVADAGAVFMPPIMPGWNDYPIRDTLQQLWGCPVSVNNDAELGVLGEWAFGAGRGERNLAYIKVGTGIGAGLMVEGKIYRGVTGSAGEIGHLTIEEDGPLCACGNHGCLEAIAGGRAIALQAQEAVQKNQRTILSAIQPVESITAREVAQAARQGDLLAQKILARAGTHIGIAIAGLVNLLNPSLVIIGGGVAQTGDILLEPIRQAVQRRSLPAAVRAVRITTAMLGRRSSGLGAVIQALTIALHRMVDSKEIKVSQQARFQNAEISLDLQAKVGSLER